MNNQKSNENGPEKTKSGDPVTESANPPLKDCTPEERQEFFSLRPETDPIRFNDYAGVGLMSIIAIAKRQGLKEPHEIARIFQTEGYTKQHILMALSAAYSVLVKAEIELEQTNTLQ